MKKLLYAIFIFLFWINFFYNTTFWSTWNVVNNSIEWNVWTYQSVKTLEFILNIEWSALIESLKSDKSRLIKLNDWTYSIKNIKRNEEKLALQLTNSSWQSIIYTNFDSPKWFNYTTKQFHKTELVKHNGQLKSKIIIYLHPDIDIETARLFLTNDSKWREVDDVNYDITTSNIMLKTVSYIYVWLDNKKMWRVIKIN